MTKEYEVIFNKYASQYKNKNLIFNYIKNKEIQVLKKKLTSYQKKYKDILDIGCGAGDYIPTLLEIGDFIQGVDSSQEMLRLAPRHQNVQYKNSNFLHTSFDNQFDLITCLGVLEFNCSVDKIATKVKPLLKKGGHVIVMSPRDNFITDIYGLYHQAQGVKIYRHTQEEIIRAFDQFTKTKNIFPIGPLNFLYVFESE